MKKLLLTVLLIFLLAGKGWADSILVGTDTQGTNNLSPNYVLFSKFTASASGNAEKIRLYSLANGNAKVALYSDSGGSPNSLLASATGACTINTWSEFTISSVAINSGTVYWLASNTDTDGASSRYAAVIPRKYKAATYSTYTFPATFDGTGFTDDNNGTAMSAYSVTVIVPPQGQIIFIQ